MLFFKSKGSGLWSFNSAHRHSPIGTDVLKCPGISFFLSCISSSSSVLLKGHNFVPQNVSLLFQSFLCLFVLLVSAIIHQTELRCVCGMKMMISSLGWSNVSKESLMISLDRASLKFARWVEKWMCGTISVSISASCCYQNPRVCN